MFEWLQIYRLVTQDPRRLGNSEPAYRVWWLLRTCGSTPSSGPSFPVFSHLRTKDFWLPRFERRNKSLFIGKLKLPNFETPDNTPIDNDIDWVWWLLIVPVLIWERLTDMVSLLDLLALQCSLLLSNGCPSSGNLTNMACLKKRYPIMRWS